MTVAVLVVPGGPGRGAGVFMPDIRGATDVQAAAGPRRDRGDAACRARKSPAAGPGPFRHLRAAQAAAHARALGLDMQDWPAEDFLFDASLMPDKSLRLRALPRPEVGARPQGRRPDVRGRTGAPRRRQSQRMVSMKIAFRRQAGSCLAVLADDPAGASGRARAAANAVVKAPDWSVGSEWHYSDGYAVKVSVRLAARARCSTGWTRRASGSRARASSATTPPAPPPPATRSTAPFPTMPACQPVGRKPLTFQREYLNNGKLMVHASSWTVEGRETITVPAGTFDCWVIVWRTRSLRSDWTGFERWWYSPQAQNYVRMEYQIWPRARRLAGPDELLAGRRPRRSRPIRRPAAPRPSCRRAGLPARPPPRCPSRCPEPTMVVTAAPISPAPSKQARVAESPPRSARTRPRVASGKFAGCAPQMPPSRF